MQVGADIAGLAAVLRKPLRPLWVSQASRIWLDAIPAPSELAFTPIYLVSASLPNARMRRMTGAFYATMGSERSRCLYLSSRFPSWRSVHGVTQRSQVAGFL